MVAFQFETLLSAGPQTYLTGITDLDIHMRDGVPVLYAASGISGGVSAYQLSNDGSVSLLDREAYGSSGLQAGPSQLEEMSVAGNTVMISLGWHDNALQCFDVNAAGQMTGTGQLLVQGGLPSAMVGMKCVDIAGTDMIYASLWGQQGLTAYQIGAGEELIQVAQIGAGDGPQGIDLVAIETAELGGQTYLFTASAFNNEITSYSLSGAGIPVEVARMGNADGLSITAPSALVPVELDGVQYLLVAAAGSGSLSVLRVDAGGALVLADHVLDDLDTRFQSVSALEAITIQGQVFVVAGGGDDGLSLFTLTPEGRLLHLGQVADNAQTALTNITAIELHDRGGILDIFASGEGEAGITHLSVDLGNPGTPLSGGNGADTLTGTSGADLIDGGAGNDSLNGGAGNDILLDGAGRDTLRGGAGEDIFVLGADGETDVIADFTLGEDRIDISALGFFHNLGQISITATYSGALISAGGETLELISSDFNPLDASDFQIGDLVDMVHYAELPEPPAGPIEGGAGNDNLQGDLGANQLVGGAGNDLLQGAAGNDTLEGGSGNDTLIGGDGADRMDGAGGLDTVSYADAASGVGARLDGGVNYAGATGDVIISVENLVGSAFNDALVGNGAANRLEGGGGDDTLVGGGGDDLLIGGAGADQILGQGGTDTVSYASATGGVGARLDGGTGYAGAAGDVISSVENLIGSNFNDALVGSGAANRLEGGAGDDTILGGGGNDTLIGGAGADQLFGQGGNDTVSYADATSGVGALLNGAAGYAGAAGDVINSVENLIGSNFDDALAGNGAANLLQGGNGRDTLLGAAGNDTLLGGNSDDLMIGGSGADHMDGQGGFDTVSYAGSARGVGARLDGRTSFSGAAGDVITNVERLIGSSHNDALVGNDAANQLEGGAGNDTLFGGGGDDLLIGGAGADQLFGQGGIDTVSYANATGGVGARLDGGTSYAGAAGDVFNSVENLIGSDFNDALVGSAVANELAGGAGNDTLLGGGGDDLLIGGAGADQLFGQGGHDTVSYADATTGVLARLDGGTNGSGASGDFISGVESLIGSDFDDALVGSAEDNQLQGGGGDDTLFGGAGDDMLLGGAGADQLFGQGGNDTVSYADATTGVLARLDGGTNSSGAAGDIINSVENLIGSGFNDALVGNTGANRLDGAAGNDTLLGGGGNDTLTGGAGDDRIYGQGGSDVFVFADGFGNDHVIGFNAHDAAEKIDLSALGTIVSYSALVGNGHMTQTGADVVIDDHAGNSITLENVQLGTLDSTDFIF